MYYIFWKSTRRLHHRIEKWLTFDKLHAIWIFDFSIQKLNLGHGNFDWKIRDWLLSLSIKFSKNFRFQLLHEYLKFWIKLNYNVIYEISGASIIQRRLLVLENFNGNSPANPVNPTSIVPKNHHLNSPGTQAFPQQSTKRTTQSSTKSKTSVIVKHKEID